MSGLRGGTQDPVVMEINEKRGSRNHAYLVNLKLSVCIHTKINVIKNKNRYKSYLTGSLGRQSALDSSSK